jgi:cysteinyl-tRNA synthetase
MTRSLEEFVPIREVVGIYSCGLTVQGLPHIGHIRAAITRDVLARWLQYLGYTTKTIENFTDIDDKIIEKQKEYSTDWRIIAETNIKAYLSACDLLNIQPTTVYPRASQHIEEIISIVKQLVDKGYAYEVQGDVYFKVRSFPDYGKLSKKSIDDLVSGARIEPTEHKKDPLDFALWKAAKSDEPYWFSPWGKGRPGWHIECSAMSMHHLGETFDIHTGGEDLIFPHHENEIAQSCAATDAKFARYWLHNGWVTLKGEKMSKSTGHFFLIDELLREYSPNVVRMYLLKTHYRNQIEFSRERLDEARAAYLRIAAFLSGFKSLPDLDKPAQVDKFTEAMNDDLNAPRALGIIFDLVNKGYETDDPEIAASVEHLMAALGFRKDKPTVPFSDVVEVIRNVSDRLKNDNKEGLVAEVWNEQLQFIDSFKTVDDVFPSFVDFLLRVRNRLRKEKNYELADFIRDELGARGIQIRDKGTDASTYRLEKL